MTSSSPKLGSETITPSMRSRFFWNSAAHRFASSCVSTAPCLLSSGPSTTESMPAFATAWIISSCPTFASWSGKNPRFPTMTPIVILFPDIKFLIDATCYESKSPTESLSSSSLPRSFPHRREVIAIDGPENRQKTTPPDGRMHLEKYNRICRRMRQFIKTRTENQHTIDEQG